MSVELLSRRGKGIVRPAPPDARAPARSDGPPDGWAPFLPSGVDRGVLAADRSLFRLVDSVGDALNRRTFLRRLGQAGLLLGLTGARVLGDSAPSYAAMDCNACVDGQTDHFPGACGPSERCADVECAGGGDCNLNHTCMSGADVKGRPWNGSTCISGQGGYWSECCSNEKYRCRDCCGCRTHPGSMCTSCGGDGDHWKCICRSFLENGCSQQGDQC
jgi:hypothetical protein